MKWSNWMKNGERATLSTHLYTEWVICYLLNWIFSSYIDTYRITFHENKLVMQPCHHPYIGVLLRFHWTAITMLSDVKFNQFFTQILYTRSWKIHSVYVIISTFIWKIVCFWITFFYANGFFFRFVKPLTREILTNIEISIESLWNPIQFVRFVLLININQFYVIIYLAPVCVYATYSCIANHATHKPTHAMCVCLDETDSCAWIIEKVI